MIPHFFTLQNLTASIISFSFISIEWRGRIPEVIPIMSIHPHPDVIDGESWKDLKPRNSVPYQVTIVTTKINAIHVKCNLPPPYATVYNIHVSDTCYYWSKDTSTLVSKKELTVFTSVYWKGIQILTSIIHNQVSSLDVFNSWLGKTANSLCADGIL